MKWASTVSSCMVYIEASYHMSQATVMVTHLLNDGSSYRFPVNHFLKWTAGQPKQTAKRELKTNIRNTRLARSKANCKRITSSSFNNRLKNKELKKEGSVWVYLIRTTIKSWFSREQTPAMSKLLETGAQLCLAKSYNYIVEFRVLVKSIDINE